MQKVNQSTPVFDFALAQKEVHAWMKPFKLGYWAASYMGDKLCEEKREVTQQLINFEYPDKYGPYDKKELGMELGDVLFAVICLGNTGAELTATCEGTGPFEEPRIALRNIDAISRESLTTFELDAKLTEAVGAVCKDIQRMPHGPKHKDKVSPQVAEHLNAVAVAVAAIAAAMDINLNEAWGQAMEKYNIRDANRWEKKQIL